MKPGAAPVVRIKLKRRRIVDNPRKMPRISAAVNGADECRSYAADESVVRQLNLAAAFHDHISCTKSADFFRSGGPLPCEKDHIYACEIGKLADVSPKKFFEEIKQLKKVLFVQLELIKQLEEEINEKNQQIAKFKREVAMLKARLERRDHRVSLLRRRHKTSDEETKTENSLSVVESVPVAPVQSNNISTAVPTTLTATEPPVVNQNPKTISSINLVTRYFGRSSKTIPSRALKRRYLGPPKTVPSPKVFPKALSPATPLSSPSEVSEEVGSKTEILGSSGKPVIEKTPLVCVKRSKRRGRPKGVSRKTDFLTTEKPYFIPVNHLSSNVLETPENEIHVPCWELKPVTSFYQMEGTENINDIVFERRHLKYEKDEKRYKRWDIQRIREQKVSEKLKNKYCKKPKKEPENPLVKLQSLNPDPHHIQYIEITDQLPVMAFGHLIPVFQPSEFSLPWRLDDKSKPVEVPPAKVSKRCRQSSATQKVT